MMMELRSALQLISDRFNGRISVDDLLLYAAEDSFGGADSGHFPIKVSVSSSEGRLLYALVRALRPTNVLEIGTADGGSATHLLAALARNEYGRLLSIDINPQAGGMIPDALRSRWTLLAADALTSIPNDDFQLVFEDGRHDYDFTRQVLEDIKSVPVVISHDTTYADVHRAFYETFPDAFDVIMHGGATGLALHITDAADGQVSASATQPNPRLLIAMPSIPYGLEAPFEALLDEIGRDQRGWQVHALAQEWTEDGAYFDYPEALQALPIDREEAADLRAASAHAPRSFVFLQHNARRYSRMISSAADAYDVVLSLSPHFMMAGEGWESQTPLVSFVPGFDFEKFPQNSLERTYFWETMWRIGERSDLVLLPSERLLPKARDYNFPATAFMRFTPDMMAGVWDDGQRVDHSQEDAVPTAPYLLADASDDDLANIIFGYGLAKRQRPQLPMLALLGGDNHAAAIQDLAVNAGLLDGGWRLIDRHDAHDACQQAAGIIASESSRMAYRGGLVGVPVFASDFLKVVGFSSISFKHQDYLSLSDQLWAWFSLKVKPDVQYRIDGARTVKNVVDDLFDLLSAAAKGVPE